MMDKKNNFKKYFASLLSLIMVFSIFAVLLVVPAAASTELRIIESFETYSVGTNVSEISGWKVTTTGEGDSATIETDSLTGSKALKITSSAVTGVTVQFSIPKITSGLHSYSFDFHSVDRKGKATRLGALYDSAGVGIVSLGTHPGDYIIRNNSTSTDISRYDANCNNIKVVFDGETRNYTIYYNGTEACSGTYRSDYNPNRIDFIITNTSGTDATWYIDNIKLEPANTYVYDDFENHEVGVSPSVANSSWKITATGEGDSVTVETDTVTGSKALKLVHSSSDPMMANFDIPDITSGKYWYSFDFRSENDTRYFSRFSAFRTNEDWYGAISFNCKIGYIYDNNGNATIGSIYGDVKNIKMLIDKDENTYQVRYNGTLKTPEAKIITENRIPGLIGFRIENNSSLNGNTGDSSKPAVYWIDNIKIERAELEVEEYTPNTTDLVSLDSDISVKFNTKIDSAYLTNEYFAVSKDGVALDDEYTVSSSDNKTVDITLADGLSYSSEYTVTVKAGIAQAAASYMTLNEDFSFDFATEKRKEEVFYDDFENHIIGNSPSVKNSAWTVRTADDKDSVTVETDPLTGSKALKITSSSAHADGVDAIITIPELTKGLYSYSFDFRSVDKNGKAPFLGAVRNSGGYGIINILTNDADSFVRYIDNSKYLGTYSNDYNTIKIVFDAETREHTAYWNGDVKASAVYRDDKNPNQIYFRIKNTAGTDAVWYFDNIKIERESLKVSEYAPNTTDYVTVDSDISVKFNTKIDSAYLTNEYFEVKENGNVLEADKYTVSSDDNKTVKITLADGLSYSSEYTVTVKAGIAQAAFDYMILEDAFTFDFTTEEKIEYEFIENFDDHEEGNSPSVKNSKWNVKITGEGDSVTVETDSVTRNKALKIVNASEEEMTVYLDITDITSGKFWYSFDIRKENNTRHFNQLGSVRSDNDYYGAGALGARSSQNTMYWDVIKPLNIINHFDSGEYRTVKFFIDADNKEYKVYSKVNGVLYGDYKASNATELGRISFKLSNNPTFNGTDGDTSKAAVYWIDNIKMEYASCVDLSVSKDGEIVTSLENCAGNVDVSLVLNNVDESDYTALIVLKDEKDILKSVTQVTKEEFIDNSALKQITIPSDVTADWNIEAYLFDSLSGIKPITEKAVLRKN